jgi:hypothetical protein
LTEIVVYTLRDGSAIITVVFSGVELNNAGTITVKGTAIAAIKIGNGILTTHIKQSKRWWRIMI